jgi:hypothetical protein
MANRAAAGGVRDSRHRDDPDRTGARKRGPEHRLVRSKHRDDSALNPGRFCPPVVADFRRFLLKKDYWLGN